MCTFPQSQEVYVAAWFNISTQSAIRLYLLFGHIAPSGAARWRRPKNPGEGTLFHGDKQEFFVGVNAYWFRNVPSLVKYNAFVVSFTCFRLFVVERFRIKLTDQYRVTLPLSQDTDFLSK